MTAAEDADLAARHLVLRLRPLSHLQASRRPPRTGNARLNTAAAGGADLNDALGNTLVEDLDRSLVPEEESPPPPPRCRSRTGRPYARKSTAEPPAPPPSPWTGCEKRSPGG